MKKLVLFISLLICSINIFGQNIFNFTVRARGGIIVGLDGIKIDSITSSNDTLSFWHNGSEIHQKGGGVGTTVGQAFLNLVNPSAITFPRINADNSVTALSAANFKTALSLTSTDVGLGNVTNKAQVEVEDSLAMLLPYILDSEAQSDINDTIVARLAAASVGVVGNDSINGSSGNDYFATPAYVASYVGAGGAGAFTGDILRFIIGTTTGAPSVGDSTIIHSGFSGKHVDLYRNGSLQWWNIGLTANVIDSTFRKASESDTIFVKPTWANNEKVEIRIREPNTWSYLSLEGEESTLLTGLSAYWKLDETSGSTADDATDTQDASVAGSPSRVVAKLGYGIKFSDAAHVLSVETPVSALDLDTTFSVSFWMKLDSMPSASARVASYIMYGLNTTTPTTSQRIYIPGLAGYIDNPLFMSANTAGVSYQVAPNDAGLSDSTWYHIVVVQRGHGDTLYMYVNNVRETLSSGAGGIFSGTVGGTDDALRFGNSGAGAPWYLDGILDEIAIWKRELTPAEVGQLYNGGIGKTHPFN